MVILLPAVTCPSPSGRGIGHFRRFVNFPSSAATRESIGQGNTWGAPTTRNDTIAVVEKMEVVRKDRGGWIRNGIEAELGDQLVLRQVDFEELVRDRVEILTSEI
ncbi:hypothetical protein TWF481_000934 [Arthrobotrys musiformis]|uniref:Uncharacterized protein n=1 Tax=Arthrobotrys musiformis TaxID=47236 RepID=A0AAV9WR46_9PEZI